MRVLVTGATGFVGFEVARQLAVAGVRPRLLVRRPQRAALLAPLDAELVAGDLRSPASLARAVDGMDAVIHLAARAAFESYARVRPSIVDGSLALFRAARQSSVSRFVYASSLLVYGDQEGPIDADTEARPVVAYGRAKLEAERALERESQGTDIRLASIRLPHVYGARDLLFERLRTGWVVMAGAGTNRYAHLHVADAARVLTSVARRGWQGVSTVADDRSADWREFMDVLRAHYPRLRLVHLPETLARLGTELLRPLNALRRRPSLYTPDTVVSWNLNLPVEPGLLWDEIGLRPAYPTIYEGLPAALDECVAFRWRHPHYDPARY